MNRIYYFGVNNYSGAWIIVLPTLGKIWESLLRAFATTTTIKEGNHDKASGSRAYI
jgi:hypothetical protein